MVSFRASFVFSSSLRSLIFSVFFERPFEWFYSHSSENFNVKKFIYFQVTVDSWGMGYELMRTYGLWYENPCPPSRWIAQGMDYEGLWVNRSMGYKGSDCSINTPSSSRGLRD